jgi:glycosyltransferase involved in cell wall biosynthesis
VHWFNQRLDLVTALSTEVRKILVDSGVRVPIAVVGAGIDHVPVAATENAPQPKHDAEFRFLHVSSCFPRKAPDVLLEAWSRAFTRADPVRLVIKTFPNPHNDIEAQVAALREKHPQAAPIEIVNQDIDEAALARLYRSCHAYVGASRGEGFGMPLAEAMIHDLPVITTAWGGQMDFCDEETAWLVDYTFAHSGSHLAEGVSLWAEPDVGQLAERMREVRDASEDVRRQRTQRARSRVVSNFYWGNVARRTESAVRALSLMPQLNERLRVGWVTTWNTRCGIAEYTRYLVETLPHESALILANRTPDLLGDDEAHVLRCWESGLAPAETMDEVFEQVMARKLDAVVIQYNFGFVTLPVLARLITRLRRHGVGVHCIFHATAEFMHENQWLSLGNIRDDLARANRLFVHSLADLNRLKSYGLASNSALLLHGVRAPRAPHAVAGEAKVIASFGFLLPGKGLPQLIEAFASLAATHPLWKLRLVNALYPSHVSDEEHQRCRELITSLGLDGRIELITDFLSEDKVLDRLADAALIAFPYQATKESSSAAVDLR